MPNVHADPATLNRPPASILIVRASAIGDVLMASPVAQALRETYPDARISWAVEPLSAPIVRANPYVDEVILVDSGKRWPMLLRQLKWGTFWREVRAFARELRARNFDLVLDCHGLLKSGIISGLTHAPRRIGASPPREGNHLFMTELTPLNPRPTHLADRYLAILAPLGIAQTPRRPVLVVPEDECRAAREFLAAQGLREGDRYVACCLASSRPQKDWVFSRWGKLSDHFRERDGLRTVLIGGAERKADAARLSTEYISRPISAVGETSLLASAAIVQGAVGVVGVDTGLTYAGMPVDVPTVALYGSTSATWLSEEPLVTVIQHQMACAPCNRHPKCEEYDCMRAITVEDVAEALRALRTERFMLASS